MTTMAFLRSHIIINDFSRSICSDSCKPVAYVILCFQMLWMKQIVLTCITKERTTNLNTNTEPKKNVYMNPIQSGRIGLSDQNPLSHKRHSSLVPNDRRGGFGQPTGKGWADWPNPLNKVSLNAPGSGWVISTSPSTRARVQFLQTKLKRVSYRRAKAWTVGEECAKYEQIDSEIKRFWAFLSFNDHLYASLAAYS